MLYWILAAMAVYLVGVFLPSLPLIGQIGLKDYLGSRDADPAPGKFRARAQRATRNMQETLQVFLALAVLSMVVPGSDAAQALLGAQIYVLARAAYLPLYLAGIPVLRSAAFIVGLAGMLILALAMV